MSLKEIAAAYAAKRKYAEEAKELLKNAEGERDAAEEMLINEMIASGQKSAKFDGLGTFSLTKKFIAKVPAEKKQAFFEWLRSVGQDALIKEDVHYQTLNAWANEIELELLSEAHKAGLDYEDRAGITFRRA